MKRYGGWLALVALLTLGGTYSGVIYHTSVKIGGGYEGGSGLSVQDDGALLTTSTATATRYISTVATGTAPLTVASTTVVPNLYVARAQLADTATAAATAFDISDDTNLTASAGIVRTDDSLTHDTAAGYKHIPTGGTDGQALLSTGVSGEVEWSANATGSTTPFYALDIGGGYGSGTGATIYGNGEIKSDSGVSASQLVVYSSVPSLFLYPSGSSPYYNALGTSALSASRSATLPDASGLVVVQPSGTALNYIPKSNGDGTYTWAAAAGALGDVETLSTAGALGTAPVSDGDTTLTMTDIVTQTELGSYSPTLGTNTTGNYVASVASGLGLTGGAAGSEGAALTLALDESAALSGDHDMLANTEKFGVNGIIFEGATANTYEGYLTLPAMGSDLTWTFPDIGGTIALTGVGHNVSFGTIGATGAVSFQNRYYNQGLYNAVYSNQVDVATEGNITHKAVSTTGGVSYSFEPTTASNGNAFYRLFRYASLNGTGKAYFYIYEPNTSTARFTVDAATGDTTSTGTVSSARVNTTGGVHVGGTSDPGTDNLIVDGTSTLTGNVDTAGVVQAGSGNINLTNSTGNLLWAAMETPTIKQTIILTAAGGEPTTTAGCAASAKKETTTNKRNYRSLDFDAGTDESAFWNVTTLPENCPTGATFTVNVRWKAAGTGNVCWSAASVASSHDDAYDAALGTAVTGTVAVTAAGDEIKSSLGTMTPAGTLQAGDSLYVQLTRDADNGADTVATDVEVLGVSLDYTPRVN